MEERDSSVEEYEYSDNESSTSNPELEIKRSKTDDQETKKDFLRTQTTSSSPKLKTNAGIFEWLKPMSRTSTGASEPLEVKSPANNVSMWKRATTDIFNIVRSKVSADKQRYKVGGYDLDLTYITERIIGNTNAVPTVPLLLFFSFFQIIFFH